MFALLRRHSWRWLAGAVAAACGFVALYPPGAQAALTLNSTRIIYDGGQRNAALVINNPSLQPFAVQAWVNTEADDQSSTVPFLASPALFRLDPGSQQQVRINGLPNDLPGDRESLFFFNAQEIPEAGAEQSNQLTIALRTRLKLFYRPKGLKGSLLESLPKLTFSRVQGNGQAVLQVHNPSPFHVTFASLRLTVAGKSVELDDKAMVKPFSSQDYTLPTDLPAREMTVNWSVITDHGGITTPARTPLVH
jgi:P pilus assembly chaperone PapD